MTGTYSIDPQLVSQVESALARHASEPDVSIQDHVRRCKLELAASLQGRMPVYLDLKYWIGLRQAAADIAPGSLAKQLLVRLRELVAKDLVFCPISEGTFAELLKQSDPVTRMATARLVDELSLGVSLVPVEERSVHEVRSFVFRYAGGRSVTPVASLVWTKLSCVFGAVHPTQTGFAPDDELALQKAFFDHLWTLSLSEMVSTIGGDMPHDGSRFERLAASLNTGNAQHAGQLRSFQQTYQAEVTGVVDLYGHVAANVVREITEQATGRTDWTAAEWQQLPLSLANALRCL